MADAVVEDAKPRKSFFANLRWFDEKDTPEERKLIWKLDLLIIPYALLVYWVKYLDAANLNNAYVSGMKEDLNLGGNGLSHLQSVSSSGRQLYRAGAVRVLLSEIAIAYPHPEFGSRLGHFQFATVQGYSLIRIDGLSLLHWSFRRHELGRRGSCFYIGLALGTLTASLLQAAATKNPDGVNGLEGWRWNFVITSVCTLPLAFFGWFVYPGTPDRPNRFSITKKDVEIAKKRLEKAGHKAPAKWTWALVKKLFTTWHLYVLLFWDIMFWNGSLSTANGGYLLWIKSLERYSVPEVNNLGATMPAIDVFITPAVCFGSDFSRSPHWAITLANIVNILGLLIIVIWNVPEPGLWFAVRHGLPCSL